MKKDDIDRIIGLALNKEANEEANEEEHAILNQWLKNDPKNRILYNNLKNIKNKKPDLHPDIKKRFEKIWNKTSQAKRFNISPGLKKVAAILLICIVSLFVLQFIIPPQKSKSTKIAYIEKRNPSGQKSKIMLPDGSIVWLNAESRISYQKNFNDTLRLVKLTGEAYFEIKKDTLRPFRVDIANLSTRVLGTSFNINGYKDNDQLEIALETGALLVENQLNKEQVCLQPGEIAVCGKDNLLKKNKIERKDPFGWKDGIIEFNDAQLDDILKVLERWYGVNFIMESSPDQQWSFTGTFRNEYLENILEVISFSENFEYTIEKDTITLKF